MMLNKSMILSKGSTNCENRTHKKNNSNSTIDSSEFMVESKPNKQKSQLCKKFMEVGYCPYEIRCKFAHGLVDLRKNNEYNSKYKTKECGSFKNNQFCVYGDRCNFIHVTGCVQKDNGLTIYDEIRFDLEMRLIRKINQKESKILKQLL